MHEAIISSFYEGLEPVEEPVFHMMGGGPASGKSQVLESGHITLPENLMSLDSDALKLRFPEYREMLDKKDKEAAAFSHEESSYLAKKIMRKGMEEGFNVNLDGTGDGSIKSVRKKVAAARKAGMAVKANYMTIDTDLSAKISQARYEKTGRWVPMAILRNTHRAVSEVLPQAMEEDLYDDVTLWDNNVKDNPVLVMTKKRGQEAEIHDKTLWKRFLDKADEEPVAMGRDSERDPVSVTTPRMARILSECLHGTKPRQKDTPAEARFRKELKAELKEMPEGAVIDFPVDYDV